MEQMIEIEKKMKRSGADLSHIMRANPKRTCLDRITVPRNFSMKTPCFKFRVSFYYCLFCIFLIDIFILLKDIIQIAEVFVYMEDYPPLIKTQLITKTILITLTVLIEGMFVLKKKKFNGCKLLYALKLFQICIVFYHIFMDRNVLEEQCNTWLKNPVHEFYRDSRDTNGHRPMTMIYNCNFERVFEDPSKSNKNKNQIHYYTYN